MNEPSPRLAEANDMELATTRSLPLWRTARRLFFSRTGGSTYVVWLVGSGVSDGPKLSIPRAAGRCGVQLQSAAPLSGSDMRGQ